MNRRAEVLLLAVGLDLLAGEPPDWWHPVHWLGRALAWAEARAWGRTLGAGAAAIAAPAGAAGAGAAVVATLAQRLGLPGLVLEAMTLKPTFAIRRLGTAAAEVESALRAGDVADARRLVGRHLVSRETRHLDAGQVASAAIESVAENLGDSVAGPLLAYALGGLPAAWSYRVVNTADAMWGYRGPRYERFGKAAARLDDAANLIPARVAAAAIVAGAAAARENAAGGLRVAWRDGARTESPNAGWPMAAMAGALGVTVVKPGAYRLGGGAPAPGPGTIRRARRVFAAAAALIVAAAWLLAARRRAR